MPDGACQRSVDARRWTGSGPQPGWRDGAARAAAVAVGSETTWRTVGEDEADPAAGRIAWITPVAQALLGAEPGDLRELPTGEVEVLRVEALPGPPSDAEAT